MKVASVGAPGEVKIIDCPDLTLDTGGIIVKVSACGICSTDVKQVHRGTTESIYALGHEVAGVIYQSSPESGWKVGQRVAAAPYLPCGSCYYCRQEQYTLCPNLFINSLRPGGMSEFFKASLDLASRGTFSIPDNLPDDIAALAEPVGCVIKGIEDSNVQPGNAVLIIGDGPMGQIGAGVARAYGAYPVIVAGMTPHRLEIAKQHYADMVINVTQQDLHQLLFSVTENRGADVVIAAVSSKEALISAIENVRPGGVVNAFAGVPEGTKIELDVRKLHYQQILLTGSFGVAPTHLAKALALLNSGRFDGKPIITARFPLKMAADAIRYVSDQTGLKAMIIF